MKTCLFGLTGIPPGKHNVKDARLDQAHKLVDAKKRTYAQVDVAGEEDLATADAIVVSESTRLDVILRDLEFVEGRLERNPPEPENAVLHKIKAALEQERFVAAAGLTPEEGLAVSAHAFLTAKPVVVASAADRQAFDEFLVRVLAESGYICYLTVGGPENRAWLIRKGMTAQEAAGVIHTDIQKGFIRAEVIKLADYQQYKTEVACKEAGKMSVEGKEYVVADGDIMHFRFNV